MIEMGSVCDKAPAAKRRGRDCCFSRRRRRGKSAAVRDFEFGRVTGDEPSRFACNTVRTSKYTVLTFVPLLLVALFQKKAYIYFLVIAVLVFIPEVSPVQPYGPVAALSFLVLVSAVREGVEDWRRHAEDRLVNSAACTVLRGGRPTAAAWRDLLVGDVVVVRCGELLPADVVLLASSDLKGLAFVSTVGLDGETNAKPKRVCDPRFGKCDANLGEGGSVMCYARSGTVQTEEPNRDLTSFRGTLLWAEESGAEGTPPTALVSLDNQCIFYRGSRLVTTECVLGVVVFTGRDTKIMQNFEGAAARFKITSLERRVDRYVLIVFSVLTALCIASAIVHSVFVGGVENSAAYLLPHEYSAAVSGVLIFFTYFILYSGMVPLPLYVSLELVKVLQALFIDWDVDMWYEGQPCRAKSALSDELGRVQHIFSDKTGTLTCNEMVLRRMCGRIGVSRELEQVFMGASGEEDALGEAIVLCHTVLTEEGPKGPVPLYSAESPDEKALVLGLAQRGRFVFAGREASEDGRKQFLVLGDGARYELLATLAFTSERKMMSVVVRSAADGRIMVLTKGAEHVVFERLRATSEEQHATKLVGTCLEGFSAEGLRTLALAYRLLSEQEYAEWAVRFQEASVAMDRRDERVQSVCSEIERQLVLLGATGVEDRLQEQVPETIAVLLEAGVKVWMITGDHRDTAVNIAHSCNLVRPKDAIVRLVGAVDEAEVVGQFGQTIEHNGVILTDGKTLAFVLESEALRLRFVEICSSARSVLCCRVSPKQKGQIVALIRKQLRVVTLAIGDGSNDVAMLRVADVGVGLFGKEGRQAVMASDYGVAQFRHLGPLLLFHGRESYNRIVLLLLYSFYKGMSFALLALWFSFFNLFSGQTLFESWHFGLYHVLFTSLPILVFAVTNRDLGTRRAGLLYPQLYGSDSFSMSVFLAWLARGVVDSAIIFFVCMFALGEEVGGVDGLGMGLFSVGVACMTASVVVVNAKMALQVSWWTWPLLVSLLVTVAFWFGFAVLLSATSNSGKDWSMYFVSINLMALPLFWLAVLLAVAGCMLYEAVLHVMELLFWPSDAAIVRRLVRSVPDTL